MHPYFTIGIRTIPTYSFIILLGVIAANGLACIGIRKWKLSFGSFFLLEAYTGAGGILGGKILYIITIWKYIDWNRAINLHSLGRIFGGGYVFYGALIGGMIGALLGAGIHHIRIMVYMRHFIYLIPFVHGIAKIGCFMGGCCYGIPYTGPFAVIFPKETYGLAGISLFPIQLLECATLLIIALILYIYITKSREAAYSVELYLCLYGAVRFCTEFLRYDYRGNLLGLSVSQSISLILILVAVGMIIKKRVGDGRL